VSRLRELMALVEVPDNAVKCECQQETDRDGGNLDEKVPPVVRNMMNGANVTHWKMLTRM
jgi:hypothetical protein